MCIQKGERLDERKKKERETKIIQRLNKDKSQKKNDKQDSDKTSLNDQLHHSTDTARYMTLRVQNRKGHCNALQKSM